MCLTVQADHNIDPDPPPVTVAVNSGAVLFRNCPWSVHFLQSIYLDAHAEPTDLWEQSAINNWMEAHNDEWLTHVRIVNSKHFNRWFRNVYLAKKFHYQKPRPVMLHWAGWGHGNGHTFNKYAAAVTFLRDLDKLDAQNGTSMGLTVPYENT